MNFQSLSVLIYTESNFFMNGRIHRQSRIYLVFEYILLIFMYLFHGTEFFLRS